MNASAPLTQNMDFLLLLGRALHKFGATAHTLEAILSHLAETHMNCQCQIFSTPTSLMCSLKMGSDELTQIVRIQPGEIDLEKLCEVDDIADAVIDGDISLEEGGHRIHDTLAAKPKYSTPTTIFGYALAALGACLFFGLNPAGAALGLLNGAIVGGVTKFSAHKQAWDRTHEVISAFLISLITYFASPYIPMTSSIALIISSLIVLVPGLELTLAVSELASNNLVSGSARFMKAITVFLKLTLGVFIANRIFENSEFIPLPPVVHSAGFEVKFLAIIMFFISLVILFQMRRRDWLGCAVAGLCAYSIVAFGSDSLGVDLSLLAAGTTIGVISHAFARWFNKPVTVTVLPSLILLVPGSIGLKGLSFLLNGKLLLGLEATVQVLLISITLVGGLFFSHLIINPRRNL